MELFHLKSKAHEKYDGNFSAHCRVPENFAGIFQHQLSSSQKIDGKILSSMTRSHRDRSYARSPKNLLGTLHHQISSS